MERQKTNKQNKSVIFPLNSCLLTLNCKPCPTQLCGVLQIKMNVFWHRPSQQSSAFMYITSRMSSDGDTKGASSLSPSTTITTVSSPESNIEGATHDLCHLPTYQQDLLLSKFNALSRRNGKILVPGSVCAGTSASHLCVLLVFMALSLLNRYCTSRRLVRHPALVC